jgi:hypothetical protein
MNVTMTAAAPARLTLGERLLFQFPMVAYSLYVCDNHGKAE